MILYFDESLFIKVGGVPGAPDTFHPDLRRARGGYGYCLRMV
jgi:hypothetical protein